MTGAVSITCIIQIPIRYQTAVGGSSLQAGIRLIPLAVSAPLGTMVTALALKNRRVPPLYLSLVGQLLQVIGLVFLSRGSPSDRDWRGLYGIEVVIGLGTGCNIGTAALLTPWVVEKRDIGKLFIVCHLMDAWLTKVGSGRIGCSDSIPFFGQRNRCCHYNISWK